MLRHSTITIQLVMPCSTTIETVSYFSFTGITGAFGDCFEGYHLLVVDCLIRFDSITLVAIMIYLSLDS